MILITRLALALALIAALSSAQPRHAGGNIEATTRIINDCEQRTNKFKKTLDRALGRDNVRAGQGREAQLNENASRLENQMDKVGDSWNKDHDMSKTRAHVQAALALANDINRAMKSWNMGGDAESEWNTVRAELNKLAANFGLARIR